MSEYSVLMSVYSRDNAEWLKLAIDSMIKQTVKPSEIVVVKDGPLTEELNDVISEFCNMYPNLFKIIDNEINIGLGLSLQKGVLACSYDLIARMDSDDISLENRCEKQLNIFEKDRNVDIVGGDIEEFVDSKDKIVAYRKVPTDDKEIKKYIKKRCPFNHGSVMYRKKSVLLSGNYLDLFWNEDYYLWIRMMENNCVMRNTGDVLVKVRIGADMYRRRGGIKYFKSEKWIQNYLLKKNIINFPTYLLNVTKRFIVQLLLPNSVRAVVFKIFARETL